VLVGLLADVLDHVAKALLERLGVRNQLRIDETQNTAAPVPVQ
jgi:ACT domain-containing protein